MGWNDRCEFKELVGKTLTAVEIGGDEIVFRCSDGSAYKQFHSQDCCESVDVEDVIGDQADIIGSPILVAEESSNSETDPEGVKKEAEWRESFTWTFYEIDTGKGGITIRWYGTSNGYYSESVDFERIEGPTS